MKETYRQTNQKMYVKERKKTENGNKYRINLIE